jgi:hypothetical protein
VNVRKDLDAAVGFGIPALLLVVSGIAAFLGAAICGCAPREARARNAVTFAIVLGITAGWLSYWQGQEPSDVATLWGAVLCLYGSIGVFLFALYRLANFVNARSLARRALVTIALVAFTPVVHWGATQLAPPPTPQERQNMARLNRNPAQRDRILSIALPVLILIGVHTTVVTGFYLSTVWSLRNRVREVVFEGLASESQRLAV